MKYPGRLVRAMLAEKQGGICPWCNLPLPENLETGKVSLDHIIPRSRGGPDYIWNRQVLHWECNGANGKGDQLTPEAESLAAQRGITLHEPLPTWWPGSTKPLSTGKPNPYRVARETGQPVELPTLPVRTTGEMALPSGSVQAAEHALKKAGLQVDRDAIRVILLGALPSVERYVRREMSKSSFTAPC